MKIFPMYNLYLIHASGCSSALSTLRSLAMFSCRFLSLISWCHVLHALPICELGLVGTGFYIWNVSPLLHLALGLFFSHFVYISEMKPTSF